MVADEMIAILSSPRAWRYVDARRVGPLLVGGAMNYGGKPIGRTEFNDRNQ